MLFRQNKKQRSKTFVSAAAAEDFKDSIEKFGVERALRYLQDETPRPAGISLDELAEKWLASKKGDVTPNIHRGYRRDYDNWIHERLGHREADSIDESDVQDWVDWMKVRPAKKGGSPIGPKSIADRHAILHQIFKWGSARSRHLVVHNPCKETELPKRHKTSPKGLRIPELMRLLEAGVELDDEDTADVVAFMAGTGWRISEAIALTCIAVEDEGDKLFVTMDRVHRRGVGFTEGGKSEAAIGRRLRVVGPAVHVIRRRVVGKAPGDLVFTFKDGRPGVNREGPWNPTSFRDRRWKRLVAAASLADRKPTPHWLRHTHVALCHAAGMSLAEIQRRLGHEDIQTTINIYGRMIDEMNDEAADKLALLLTPRPAREQVIEGTVVGEVAAPREDA
ncbi:tyrosine-type recombinase/integrase [Nocardioides sp. NPDC101246]|uniref:tyrosine-type recombinase/integrase n=1 Tax=Nocardioides sp. NPDC101246 TaxID=3364336 RepID=UPI0038058CF3